MLTPFFSQQKIHPPDADKVQTLMELFQDENEF
jgi:hypothetical protein